MHLAPHGDCFGDRTILCIQFWILVLFNMVYFSDTYAGIELYSCDSEFQPVVTDMLLALLLPCCTLSFGLLEADSAKRVLIGVSACVLLCKSPNQLFVWGGGGINALAW